MEELPLALLDAVPEAERDAVSRWWAGLPSAEQRQLAGLCDPRWEECFFGSADGDAPPLVFGGRFLPHDDAWGFAGWEADWREYLVEHPGQYLGDGWGAGSVVIAAQFRSFCWLGDEPGVRCRVANWSLTRLAIADRPPSEQRHAEPGAAADGGGR